MSYYQTIYNRLRKAGMTDAVALGFLGNWQQESGREPSRLLKRSLMANKFVT